MNYEYIYNNMAIIIPFHKNKNMIELSIKTLMKTIRNIPIHIIANNQNSMAYLQYNVIHISKGLMYNHPYVNNDREVQSACGAIFLTSKKHFELVNGIDEEMPFIYCDNDYSIKLKQHNLKTWVAADSIVYHIGNTSQDNSKYYSFKYLREDSKAAFYAKNKEKREIDFNKWLDKSISWYLSNSNKFHEKYIFINLSTFFEANKYIDILKYQYNIKIYDIYKYVLKDRNIEHIKLNEIIDACLIEMPIPLLYFVDNFTSLFSNKIWNKLRNTSKDLIIDVHGNIMNFDDIIKNKI